MNYPRKGRKWFLLIPLFVVAGLLLFGLVVMLLWNAILPDVLGVRALNYWQAIGLLLLGKILFGGLRRGGPPWQHFQHRREWKARWMNMTDEEKARFRDEWKRRCGRAPDKEA